MSTCGLCGSHAPERAAWGPLSTQLDPARATWRGLPLDLTATQVKILHVLAATGSATHLRMELLCLGEETFGTSLKVQICVLRKRLPPELQIRSVRGWGYELALVQPPALS